MKVQSSRTRPLSGIDGPPPGGGGGNPTPGIGDVSMSTTRQARRNRSRGPSGGPPFSVVTRPEIDQPDEVVNATPVMSAPSSEIGSVATSCTDDCGVFPSTIVCVRILYCPGETFLTRNEPSAAVIALPPIIITPPLGPAIS